MTKEQINIAIAESLGWHHFIINDEYGNDRALRPGEEFVMGCFFTDIPNYTTDLNAMYEIEKSITDPRKMLDYFNHLSRYNDPDARSIQDSFNIITATAAQRAEAYLRTIGKWNEKD